MKFREEIYDVTDLLTCNLVLSIRFIVFLIFFFNKTKQYCTQKRPAARPKTGSLISYLFPSHSRLRELLPY